jgi:hypothetical protein
MKFLMMAKADELSEAGAPPSPELMTEMGKLMEEATRAGVLLTTAGLYPSSQGVRLKFSGGKRRVTDGPFTESKELIASFALIQVKSKDEAIEWATRFANVVGDVEIEIRQVFD